MNARVYVVPVLLLSSTLHPAEKPKPPLAVAPFDEAAAKRHQKAWGEHLGAPVEVTDSIGMKLVLVPAGEFMMGSGKSADSIAENLYTDVKHSRNEAEYPQHRVRITKPYYLGAHEVTVGQFRRFVQSTGYKTEAEWDGMGGYGWNLSEKRFEEKPERIWSKPGFLQTDRHPVTIVSWNDAVAFCNWLSRTEGRTYRLPTEAEWEYACRAGTRTRYYSGPDEDSLEAVANIADQSVKAKWPTLTSYSSWDDGHPFAAPVGRLQANGFGLYDMHGNVFEWCHDWYATDYYGNSPLEDPRGPRSAFSRVSRGGSWSIVAWCCRSACRMGTSSTWRSINRGFRVALVPTRRSSRQECAADRERTDQRHASDGLSRPTSSEARRQSPWDVLRVRVDLAQERGKITRTLTGWLTDPPRTYNYMMNPNAGKTGRDNPRIEFDKDDPNAEGMNAVWLEAFKPRIAGLGWGGDVWYVYDPWPEEGVYDWDALDQWIESHLARGTKVTLKFSLVPRWLWSENSEEESGAAQQLFPYLKKGHVSPPSDYGKWEELVYQTVQHLNIEKKYNVRFEPWNEPDARFWLGTQQQYHEMYDRTAKAIRRADPQAKIGGPTLTGVRRDWLEPFLKHCAEKKVPVDFISWHYYLWHGLQTGHVHSFAEQAAEVRELVAQYPSLGQPELCVSEWAYMWHNTDMPSPTFNAAFTLQSLSEMLDGGITEAFYCGPLGPVKSPDPAVNAFMMYNALGPTRIRADVDADESDVRVLATKTRYARGRENLSIVLWNYPFDAERIIEPQTSPGASPSGQQELHQKRMQALNDMVADALNQPASRVEVILENLPPGDWIYERYLVDAAHCSQPMRKVDKGKLQTGGGAQLRFVLEPYSLTSVNLRKDRSGPQLPAK